MRRRLAKTLYWIGGKLSKIQTPRKTYRLVSTHPFVTEPAGRRWSSCQTSMRFLQWSMRLDWDHWGHWALQHNDCEPQPCPQCGGCFCPEEDDEQEAEELGSREAPEH